MGRDLKKQGNAPAEIQLLQCLSNLQGTSSGSKQRQMITAYLNTKSEHEIVKEPFGEWFNYYAWLKARIAIL